jgi:hypothetical protein
METNLISQSWGSESGRTGGLADTCVYKEVAMAKLTTKNKPRSNCGGNGGIWEGRGMTSTWWGSCSNPRSRPHGLRHDTWADGPKDGDAALWQILDVHLFRWFPRCLRYVFDMRPIPLEALWNFLSNHIKNVPNGVRMRSWRPLQVGSVMQSESSAQNMFALISFHLGPKVMWMSSGGRGEHLDLVPNQPLWSSMPSMCV